MVFCLAYIITALVGLNIEPTSGFATLVWAPAGIALATLLAFGHSFWPSVTIAAFLANMLNGASAPTAAGIAIGNTLEAVIALFFLKKILYIDISLERLQDVLFLVLFGSIVSTMVSASIGSTTLLVAGIATMATYRDTWLAWWIGDMLGILIITPLLLLWMTELKIKVSRNRWMEIIVTFAALIILSLVIFQSIFIQLYAELLLPYLLYPLLIWIALRLNQRYSVTAIFAVSIIAIWSTVGGYGPFATANVKDSLFFLQGFIAMSSITFMILSAVMAERTQLENRKDEFLAIASHELKTPLATLKMYTQHLMIQNSVSQKKPLEKMNEEIDKVTRFINELLDISIIQTGRFRLLKTHFSFTDLVQEIRDHVQSQFPTHTINLEGNFSYIVFADRNRYGQVLTNLLTNAAKYSPGKNKVIVSAIRKNSELVVRVKDFGIGIDTKYHDQIFNRYYRVEEKDAYHSSGLGLYIATHIIREHGCSIWVKSKKGKGSTFYFTIPIK